MSQEHGTAQPPVQEEEFPIAHLRYPLVGGKVWDWLVTGPLATALDGRAWSRPDGRARIVREFYTDEAAAELPPAERATWVVDRAGQPSQELRWQAAAAGEDGLLYHTGHVATWSHVEVWAYVQIARAEPASTTLTLATLGPLTLWVNGEHALHSARFFDERPGQMTCHLPLSAGVNEVLIRLETVACGDYAVAVGLEIAGASASDEVVLPTTLSPVARRKKLATVMGYAYTLADVYSGKDKLTLHWPADMNFADALTVRLQTPAGRIYAEAAPLVQAGSRVVFGAAEQFPSGAYELLLLPRPEEYYVDDMRVERRLPLQIANQDFSALYYGTPESRGLEALQDAAKRPGLWADVARNALGLPLRGDAVDEAVALVAARGAGYRRLLLGLLLLAHRHMVTAEPLVWDDGVTSALLDAATAGDLLETDDELLLGLGCRVLAAGLWPELDVDADSAVDQLADELRAIGVEGLRAWLAGDALADALATLAGVVEFGADEALAELAAATLDRLALDLALNSFQGAPGGPRSAATTAALQSARLDPLSGVCRLWWGMGAFGAQPHATVALALAQSYFLPEIIAAVAVNRDPEALTRARHAPGSAWEANQVVYRTPDYLLSAVTDYRPGQPGAAEVVWQAVLGAEARVHGNYPAYACAHDALAPNYWRGDACLPRVAQWRNVVLALYAAPDAHTAGLGFTHAYFPLAAFDEHVLQDGWLLARKGTGYVALTAATGLEVLQQGPSAQREVRAVMRPGQGTVWVCCLGRSAEDGTFADFVAAVTAAAPQFDLDADVRVRYRTPRGEELALGWDGELMVDGVAQALTGYPLLDGPYAHVDAAAGQVDVRFADAHMRLDFGPVADGFDDEETNLEGN